MASMVVLQCPECGSEKYCDEEEIEITDEETGLTNIWCERCDRNDIDVFMTSSDWTA